MTTAITLARLRDLRLSGMAQALERQQEQIGTYDALPFQDRLGLLVEQECLEREHRKQERLVRQARFKLRATIQDIDYQYPRNIQQAQIARLAQGEWIDRARNLLCWLPFKTDPGFPSNSDPGYGCPVYLGVCG
jgi:DNA replication protein DnaC